MSCTKAGLFKVSILFETLYHTQYQGRVCTTSKASYKHMYVNYLTHGEDRKVTAIYCASLTRA